MTGMSTKGTVAVVAAGIAFLALAFGLFIAKIAFVVWILRALGVPI